MKKIFPLFFFIILFTSCSQKILVQEAYSKNSRQNRNHEAEIEMRVNYVADAFEYIIFELEIENHSDEDYLIQREDVMLYLYDLEDGSEVSMPMLDKNDLLRDLSRNRQDLISEKKANTTIGIVSAGLNLLSIALTPGLNGVDAVFYSMESASYILEDRRQYDLIQGDIEEQMQYIEDWIIDEELIAPNEKISYDLLFDRTLIDADATLEIDCPSEIKTFEFEFIVKEEKI